tara:strand:+ start:867 stop:1652 length:786 start_codon:yes stop_codon:yes gene_type:complete
MDTLRRKLKGINKVYKVYTQEEAENNGIVYVHWKKASVGNYAVTDDGYVGLCIGRKNYTDKKGRVKTFIRLCHGANWAGNTNTIEYLINKACGVYSQANPRSWQEREARKTRTKNLVNAYVGQALSASNFDYEKLGKIYRPDQSSPRATVKRILKQEFVKDMIEKKLKEVMKEKGISKSSVVDTMLEAIEIARQKQDVSNMLKACDYFMELLEMKPSKKIITDTLQLDMSSNIAEAIESEERSLLVQRKEETNEQRESSKP